MAELTDFLFQNHGLFVRNFQTFLKHHVSSLDFGPWRRFALQNFIWSMLLHLLESEVAVRQRVEKGYFAWSPGMIHFATVHTSSGNQPVEYDLKHTVFSIQSKGTKIRSADDEMKMEYKTYTDMVGEIKLDYPTLLVDDKLSFATVLNVDKTYLVSSFKSKVVVADQYLPNSKGKWAVGVTRFENEHMLDYMRYSVIKPDILGETFGDDYIQKTMQLINRKAMTPILFESSNRNCIYMAVLGGLVNWQEKWKMHLSVHDVLGKIGCLEITANIYNREATQQTRKITTMFQVVDKYQPNPIITTPVEDIPVISSSKEIVKNAEVESSSSQELVQFHVEPVSDVEGKTLIDRLLSSNSEKHLDIVIRRELLGFLAKHKSLEMANVQFLIRLMRGSSSEFNRGFLFNRRFMMNVVMGIFGDSLFVLRSQSKSILISFGGREHSVDYERLHKFLVQYRETLHLHDTFYFAMVGSLTTEAHERYLEIKQPNRAYKDDAPSTSEDRASTPKALYRSTKGFFGKLLSNKQPKKGQEKSGDRLIFIETIQMHINDGIAPQNPVMLKIRAKMTEMNNLHGYMYRPQPRNWVISNEDEQSINKYLTDMPTFKTFINQYVNFHCDVTRRDIEMTIDNTIKTIGVLIHLSTDEILSLVIAESLKINFDLETHPRDPALIGVRMRYKHNDDTLAHKNEPQLFWFKMERAKGDLAAYHAIRNIRKSTVPPHTIFFVDDNCKVSAKCSS